MGAYFLKKQARSPILEGFGRNIYALLSFSGQQYFGIGEESRGLLLMKAMRLFLIPIKQMHEITVPM